MFSIHSSRKDCWSRERISETGLPTPVIWATVLSLVADMKPAGVPSSELTHFEPMIPRIAPGLCREYSDLEDLGIAALECLECLECEGLGIEALAALHSPWEPSVILVRPAV